MSAVVQPASAEPRALVTFDRHPDTYRHWLLLGMILQNHAAATAAAMAWRLRSAGSPAVSTVTSAWA